MIFIWLGPKKAAFFLPKAPGGEGDGSYLKSGRFFGFVLGIALLNAKPVDVHFLRALRYTT